MYSIPVVISDVITSVRGDQLIDATESEGFSGVCWEIDSFSSTCGETSSIKISVRRDAGLTISTQIGGVDIRGVQLIDFFFFFQSRSQSPSGYCFALQELQGSTSQSTKTSFCVSQ